MVILGIDPGLSSTGFGAIRCGKTASALLKCGHIKTSASEHISGRLFHIHADINHLIRTLLPDVVAVEKAFSLVRYPKAGMQLGGVLGVIYLSVYANNIPMVEITPREVKNSLVGYGGADKKQVRSAVRKMLDTEIKSFHASDALAVALAAFHRRVPGRTR